MSTVSKKRPLESPEVHQPNKKRKIETDVASFVNASLPKDVVLEILEYLSRNDKLRCSEVCKFWWDCASAALSWAVVGVDNYDAFYYNSDLFEVNVTRDKMRATCRRFNEHFVPGEELTFTVEAGEVAKRAAGNFQPFSIKFRNFGLVPKEFDGVAFFRHDSGKIYDSTNTKRPMSIIISDLVKALDQDKFDSESIKSSLIKIEANALKVMEADEPAVKIKYLCNAFELENLVNSGEKIELENFLITTGVVPEVAQFMAKESPKFLELSQAMFPFMPPKLDAPKGLKEEVKFHRYQLDAISWMNAIENDVDKEFKYCDLVPWRASRSSVLVDLHGTKFVSSDKVSEYIGCFKSKGGVLADAVGLGKTVEVIGLTLLSQNKEEKLPEFDEKGLFNTRATLVVCPNHLAQQWADEIKKYTSLNAILYTTLEDIKNLTYADLASASFVIATSTLFKNKNYIGLGCGNKKVTVSIPGVEKRVGHLAQHLTAVKNGEKFGASVPVLEHFHWERVIVDEAHEVFTDPVVERCVSGIPKSFGWYVSATPFPKPELYSAAKKFLEIWPVDLVPENTIGEQYEKWVENDLIYSNLIWRNTKESIASEYTVPDYVEEVVYVDFCPIETLLHTQSSSEANIKLCCGIFNYPSIDEIPARRVEELNETIARLESMIVHCEEDIQNTEKAIIEYETNPIYANVPPAQKKRNQNRNKNAIKDKKSSLKSYQNQIKETEELRDEWPKVPLVLGANKESNSNPAELAHKTMLSQHGSKMAQLIDWLQICIKENNENRFILFSKFPSYLQTIEKILEKAEINCVRLEGNVTQKTKKLKQFKEENVKVLLLCLGDAASGTNLIEANYVVLLDPMQGSIEEARAYELQALGRAHRQGQDQKVHLVRFVVRDSVEEELYVRNKSSGRATASTNRPLFARSSSSLATGQQILRRASSLLVA